MKNALGFTYSENVTYLCFVNKMAYKKSIMERTILKGDTNHINMGLSSLSEDNVCVFSRRYKELPRTG